MTALLTAAQTIVDDLSRLIAKATRYPGDILELHADNRRTYAL